jgi:hypothetical protein
MAKTPQWQAYHDARDAWRAAEAALYPSPNDPAKQKQASDAMRAFMRVWDAAIKADARAARANVSR